MNGIEGVEITVFAGEARPVALQVAEDGFLGRLKSGVLTIVARVASGLPIYGLDVDGKKDVRLRANKAAKTDPPMEGKEFHARVAVEYGEGVSYNGGQETEYREVFFTRYPANNLRLLRLEPSGEFHIWEIAIVSQNSDFFLTVQETYSGSCYKSDDGLACPKVNKWPQMIQLMADIIEEAGLASLPDLITYSEDTRPPDRYIGNTGIVLWWNHAMGMGVIQTHDGQARVHWTQSPKRPRLAFLQKDEHLFFEEVGSPVVKPRPDGSVRPTAFKLEAKGITLTA